MGEVRMFVDLKQKPPLIAEYPRLNELETGYLEGDEFKGHSGPPVPQPS